MQARKTALANKAKKAAAKKAAKVADDDTDDTKKNVPYVEQPSRAEITADMRMGSTAVIQ